MKFKFIHKISVIQERLLIFFNMVRTNLDITRLGRDPAHGLCIPVLDAYLLMQTSAYILTYANWDKHTSTCIHSNACILVHTYPDKLVCRSIRANVHT